jgi:NAD(P)-dependent dehydrogenase (short-subunit alcohol dehydrogenase family)
MTLGAPATSGRSLQGAVALVTGASSGIGQAIAQALAEHGARVLLVGRDLTTLDATRAKLPGRERHELAVVDLADVAALAALAKSASAFGGGRLDLLVHCAGSHETGSVEQTSASAFDALIATNLRAPFVLTGALLPALRQARGDVVLVNSSVLAYPRPGVAAYAASKAGLRGFADSLRAEVNGDGIRVLSVFPGRTATPMQQAQFEREGRSYRPELLLQPGEVASAILSAVCLGETAELTELYVRPRLKS